MIRKDIKEFLKDKDLDKLFLEHREDIDPENYRVGEIEFNGEKKIVVLNQVSLEIMDYYFDDSKEEWFDISSRYKIDDGTIESDKYFINRSGILKSKYINRNKTIILNEQYPYYEIKFIKSKYRTGHSKRAQIHRILAVMFIPNILPKERIYVDHIDRNKANYSLDNLRWVTIKENCENYDKRDYSGNYIYKAYEDKEYTKLVYTFTEQELCDSKFSKGNLRYCISSAHPRKSQGYFWKREDPELESYLSGETIDDDLWKEIKRFPGMYVHPLGLIKDSFGKISIGWKRYGDNCGYKGKAIKGKGYLIHTLIAEVFLNNNTPISKLLEVDHIDGNPANNRLSNLRICSHKENMQNNITRKRLSRKVIDPLGIVFNSVTECSKYYCVNRRILTSILKEGIYGFKYYN